MRSWRHRKFRPWPELFPAGPAAGRNEILASPKIPAMAGINSGHGRRPAGGDFWHCGNSGRRPKIIPATADGRPECAPKNSGRADGRNLGRPEFFSGRRQAGILPLPLSFDFTLLYFTWPFLTLLYFTLLCFILLYFTSLHSSSLHFISLHFASLCFAVLCFALLYFTLFYFTLLYLIWLHFTSLHPTSLHFALLWFTLLYVTLLWLSLLYLTLFYFT